MKGIQRLAVSNEDHAPSWFESRYEVDQRYINFMLSRHKHMVWYFNTLMLFTIVLAIYFVMTVGNYIP